jgi:peptide/nickel transport system substrate-binding protein
MHWRMGAQKDVRIWLFRPLSFIVASLLCVAVAAATGRAAESSRTHAIAMHGVPALPPDFTQQRFVRPDAPKGGRLTIGLLGSFDSLNPFIVRGQAVGAIRTFVYESLLIRSPDEPFTLYAYIAQAIEVPPDRSSITFHLDPRARFSDRTPISVDDVIFSWNVLRTHGWPNLRAYYNKVEEVTRVGERSVRMSFPAARDRELPLILGLMPVLPRHKLDASTFDQTTLQPPIGSGPYVVAHIDPGSAVVFERNPNWWARDLPITRGLFNFGELRYEFYRDANTLFEAFKKGLIDFRSEDDPNRWATQYDFPAVRDGRVKLETHATGLPRPMFGLVFNTRRPIFADVRVREAMLELFDFEWINANLFAGGYTRTASFFQGSDLASTGRPASSAEQRLLARFPNAVRPDIMEGRWRPPVSDGSGFDRQRVRRALDLLRQAGWTTRDGRLFDARGQPFVFEAMVNSREHERLLLAWKRVLDRVGIDLAIRQIDSAQFERRRQNYDYDMIPWAWAGSLSPGNEQAFRWGSRAASQPGSLNLSGAANPAVDAMIEATLAASTREELVDAARALDRVLLSGTYVLPLYNLPEQRIARWSHIEMPARPALFGQVIESWWRKPN